MTERERRRRVIDHLRSGKAKDAADELAGSRESYPGDEVLHHAIGLAFASRGTLGRAREQLEAAVNLSPRSADLVADLAQMHLAQGHAQEAIEAAEQALALKPDLPIARFTLGRACLAAECARQARRSAPPEPGHHSPLIDGRTPSYLRALREMEAALAAAPPFVQAVRTALAFAYMRAGHLNAAAEQLRAELSELSPGEEAERVRIRLLNLDYEITRERYWAFDKPDLPAVQQAAEAVDASPEAKLRLAHACAALGDEEAFVPALARAREAGYQPRAAHISRTTGSDRSYQQMSDVHLLIGGGLECVIGDELRFLPFSSLRAVALEQPGHWRIAEVRFTSLDEVEVVVPTLYRLSRQSPSDLIQSGRFTQFSYRPGESRYAHAIGTRNLTTEDGVIPFTEVQAITFE